MIEHHWEYCDHCESEMVVCGTCGNNCCNGGYGEVIGPEPGTTMDCPDCPSAYELQNKGNISIMKPIYLSHDEIEEIYNLSKKFPDCPVFELNADISSGVGATLTMTAKTVLNGIDGKFETEITGVEDW